MTRRFEVQFDSKALGGFVSDLHAKALRRAVAKSLTDGARMLVSEAKRELRDKLTLKASRISKDTAITKLKAAESMPIGRMEVAIGASTKKINIGDYQARATKKGVSVKIEKAKGQKTIRGAFFAKTKSGKRGVFVTAQQAKRLRSFGPVKNQGPAPRSKFRASTGREKFFWWELPIKAITSKSLATTMRQIEKPLSSFGNEAFLKRMEFHWPRELERIIARNMKK